MYTAALWSIYSSVFSTFIALIKLYQLSQSLQLYTQDHNNNSTEVLIIVTKTNLDGLHYYIDAGKI